MSVHERQPQGEGQAVGTWGGGDHPQSGASGPAWGPAAPRRSSPTCLPKLAGYGLTFTFRTLAFKIFFSGSWLWKKWETVYRDHTVDVLVREEERFHSYCEKTPVDVWAHKSRPRL